MRAIAKRSGHFWRVAIVTFLYAFAFTIHMPILPFLAKQVATNNAFSEGVEYGLVMSAYGFSKIFSARTSTVLNITIFFF
jgi:MFS family permease